MALVKMKEILTMAEKENYGVGAFSVANMEMVIGAIQTAEELRSPLILQIAEVRLGPSPLHLIGPMMVEAAKRASVPVAVHFDHGETEEKIKEALEIGFTSVMFDGSLLPIEQNIAETKKIVELASKYDATVEGEIGRVGGSEDGLVDIEIAITSVENAKQFAEETGVDALAIAIGNAHGVYKGKPELRLDRLKEIDDVTDIPLVLHGGSGIYQKDFRKAIQSGIRKINVATSTFNNVIKNVNDNVPFDNYFIYHDKVIQAAAENVRVHMEMFQSANRI
ncbi:fructose-bisphosphate aldolase [Sporosarcina luteola]|uniref:Fructose-bisphosphate aldolase n=1 Tax=Sporosarcina luteola TaxID=582850 RepID=A0A511Z366_9BACL|nr:class II fructose-bisphosphate aldolase [Sporosarcina luteola]GEN81904.1 fructose-bisphosphate aldolase [Sporosarcina luteola]